MTDRTTKNLMYTAKIVDIKKDVYQFSQEPFINVEVEILDAEGDVVETKKFAYKADTEEDVIVADLEKMLSTYALELDQAESQKASEELNAKADNTVEMLKDAEITMPEGEDEEEDEDAEQPAKEEKKAKPASKKKAKR